MPQKGPMTALAARRSFSRSLAQPGGPVLSRLKAAKMTHALVAEAQRRASEWKSTK